MELDIRYKSDLIGRFRGHEIFDRVVDAMGRVLRFERAAAFDRSGRLAVAQVRSGEVLIPPGLIYTVSAHEVSEVAPQENDDVLGYCSCGMKVMRRRTTRPCASAEGFIYIYVDTPGDYRIFRCSGCSALIYETWAQDKTILENSIKYIAKKYS